ncbi:actin maturation protease-like [Diadema antillarum]|uniref:actin maturation protease-like n=1 Tax=Diadema antillarum TaxID=105358 RepID=UPI003A88317D
MASNPVPPPPPPPLRTCKPVPSTSSASGSVHTPVLNEEEETRVTIQRLPDWRVISDPDSCLRWLACNRQVTHVGQEGPTCGLVALSMAAMMLGLPGRTLAVILDAARNRGFTLQGEMFSAKNTLKLAEEELEMTGMLLSGDLRSNILEILKHLAKGLPVLIPYDADYNHEPASRNGHRAHWAVLTGFLLSFPPDMKTTLPMECKKDLFATNLVYLSPPWSAEDIANLPKLLMHTSHIYMFARQGKSRLLGLWSYETLAESNKNLKEYDPSKHALQGEFIFPDEGLTEGLALKAILLQTLQR